MMRNGKKRRNLTNSPSIGLDSGGNGVTMSADGIFTVEPSLLLALPDSPELARTKFVSNLKMNEKTKLIHVDTCFSHVYTNLFCCLNRLQDAKRRISSLNAIYLIFV